MNYKKKSFYYEFLYFFLGILLLILILYYIIPKTYITLENSKIISKFTANSLKNRLEVVEYTIKDNILYLYLKPSKVPFNLSNLYVYINGTKINNIYEIGNNDSIITSNELILVIYNLSNYSLPTLPIYISGPYVVPLNYDITIKKEISQSKEWWNVAWRYRRKIIIQNPSTLYWQNVQIPINLAAINDTVFSALYKGTVLVLHFDENLDLRVKDWSGYYNDGIKKNNPKYVEGVEGGALEFNGLTQYVLVNNSEELSPQVTNGAISICAWVKVLNVGTDSHPQKRQPIVSKGIAYQWEYGLYIYDDLEAGFNLWQCSGSNYGSAIGGIVPLNIWTFVCGTYKENDSIKVYINGNMVANTSQFTGYPCKGSSPVYIAARSDGQYLNAIIDEVRIYNRALSQDEIKSLYCIGAYRLYLKNELNNIPSWCSSYLKIYSYHDADFRFLDSDDKTLLSYWREDGNDKRIWIKVPSIPAGYSTFIYMYYGNPYATYIGNGSSVFEFFDNFNYSSLDTNKWNIISGSNYYIKDQELILNDPNGSITTYYVTYPASEVRTANYFSIPFVVDIKYYHLNPYLISLVGTGMPWDYWYLYSVGYNYYISTYKYTRYPNYVTFGNYHKKGIISLSYLNNRIITNISDGSSEIYYLPTYIYSEFISLGSMYNPSKYDFILVRKYLGENPIIYYNVEEEL